MIIGVDCQHLLGEAYSGTHNYLNNLLSNLARIDHQNRYILYFGQEPSESYWKSLVGEDIGFSYQVIKSKLLWTQVGLAFATYADKPDILLCSWHTLPIIHRRSTKIISIVHDFTYKGVKEIFLYLCLVLSDTLVGVSDYTYGQILQRIPWRKSRVHKIYEGVELTKYRKSDISDIKVITKRLNLSETYFLSVGTLNARKNLENMIKAFCHVCERFPDKDLRYAIVGICQSGYEKIFEDTNKTTCSKKVHFLGRLNDSEVIDLYSGAVALLYASFEEGFGLPILEAFACSCPVITSNKSSMKEVGAEAAFLVDPDSVEDITNVLIKVLSDKEEVRYRVSKGINRVKLFSWKSCAENILGLF